MQEEVTQKTIALSMKTGKLTAQALQAALKKYLQHRAKGSKLHHGKQSLKQLKAHGAALTNIEVTEANIGASVSPVLPSASSFPKQNRPPARKKQRPAANNTKWRSDHEFQCRRRKFDLYVPHF